MLDASLRRLLEEAVNSSTKLAIVLLLAERKELAATAPEISRRVCRDIWSVETALREIADDGIIACADGQFAYRPTQTWRDALDRLLAVYDEPLLRQEIVSIVGELDRYAPYREALNNRRVTILSI